MELSGQGEETPTEGAADHEARHALAAILARAIVRIFAEKERRAGATCLSPNAKPSLDGKSLTPDGGRRPNVRTHTQPD